MDFFTGFVHKFHPLSEDTYLQFKNIVEDKTLLKGEQFVKVGQVAKSFYIIKSGVIRAFIIDEKGKEHTKTIYTDKSTTGNLNSLITKTPSKLIYECLTDCEVLECNYESFYKLSESNHELSIFHYKVLEHIYIREEKKILEIAVLNATQRYDELRKRLPNIDNLINQYHIASYLNITPVQLSRVRKNYGKTSF